MNEQLNHKKSSETIKPSEVVFLLGAGASKEAGVPTMYSFVDEFIRHDRAKGNQMVKEIVDILKKWKRRREKDDNVDIELLLETLTKLKDKDKDPLLAFYRLRKKYDFVLAGYPEKAPLIEYLKKFIRDESIVEPEAIRYLEPLHEFLADYRPLDIVSVNYDTCIEQFCNVHRLSYQDGFDVHWNPESFRREHTDIRLYKLHGSVTWYQSDRGAYVKLPVNTNEEEIKIITGEKAQNLMLYPMGKWDYPEPLLELMVMVKHLLESPGCRFVIVVGYSFRDEPIRRMLWDAARKNKELHVVLVGPGAYRIYEERLKYYDDNHEIRSILAGRVVCLPYLFEKVLPHLKNYYLRNLINGLKREKQNRQEEMKGGKPDWGVCIDCYINAEYTEKVNSLFDNTLMPDYFERDRSRLLIFPLKMAFNLYAGKKKGDAERHLSDFHDRLYELTIDGVKGSISRNEIGTKVNFGFGYLQERTGSRSIGMNSFQNIIKGLIEFCDKWMGHVRNGTADKDLGRTIETLRRLKSHLDVFNGANGIEIEEYVRHVKRYGEKISTPEHWKGVPDRKGVPEIEKGVTEIEKGVIEGILQECSHMRKRSKESSQQ